MEQEQKTILEKGKEKLMNAKEWAKDHKILIGGIAIGTCALVGGRVLFLKNPKLFGKVVEETIPEVVEEAVEQVL